MTVARSELSSARPLKATGDRRPGGCLTRRWSAKLSSPLKPEQSYSNSVIVDLPLAPETLEGNERFTADVRILRPEPGRGNRGLSWMW